MNRTTITTRNGDTGLTRLFSGERVDKDDSRIDAFGDLDELVSLLSVGRHAARRKDVKESILFIQKELFVLGSELATRVSKRSRLPRRFDMLMVKGLDQRCAALEKVIELPRGFVIPGNSVSSAPIDLARAVCRRLERKVVHLNRAGIVPNLAILAWVNRLSDLLYLLARREEGRSLPVKERG